MNDVKPLLANFWNPFPENTDEKSSIYSHWTITHVSSSEKNEALHCLEDKLHLFYHTF